MFSARSGTTDLATALVYCHTAMHRSSLRMLNLLAQQKRALDPQHLLGRADDGVLVMMP